MNIKKIACLTVGLFIISIFGFSQYDNTWLIGHEGNTNYPNGQILFSNGVADTSTMYRKMPFFRTNSIMTDSNGSILFYTNGVFIANGIHDTLLNSSDFNNGFYTKVSNNVGLGTSYSTVIIPDPKNANQYYVFHKTLDTITYQGVPFSMLPVSVRFTMVNMTLDGGLGGVPSNKKSIHVIDDTLNIGMLMACRHGNGRDWWILTPRYNDSLIYKILVTPDTLIVSSQVTGSPIYYDVFASSIFTPDGSKYLLMSQNNMLDIFDFDRCDGTLSNHSLIHLPDTIHAYSGAAVSSDNHYLYVNTQLEIYQIDLTANPYSSSIITVAQWDTFYSPFVTYFAYSQLGPDGKIYMSTTHGCDVFHVIYQPDSTGLACNVLQNSLKLPCTNLSIPNFPNYNLGPLTGSVCDTLTGIASLQKDKELSLTIAPNPVTDDVLHIKYMLPRNKTGTLTITDVTGKQVYTYRLPQWSTLQNLPVGLAEGMYFCTVMSDGMKVVKKFVLIRE